MPVHETVLPPALIETLMAVYYRAEPEATEAHLIALHRRGLLSVLPVSFEATVTGLGEAHIRQLCAMPLPTKQTVYVDSIGEKV